MNNLSKDRMILKRLVESYGKKDVMTYVKKLNEANEPNFRRGRPVSDPALVAKINAIITPGEDDDLAEVCECEYAAVKGNVLVLEVFCGPEGDYSNAAEAIFVNVGKLDRICAALGVNKVVCYGAALAPATPTSCTRCKVLMDGEYVRISEDDVYDYPTEELFGDYITPGGINVVYEYR